MDISYEDTLFLQANGNLATGSLLTKNCFLSIEYIMTYFQTAKLFCQLSFFCKLMLTFVLMYKATLKLKNLFNTTNWMPEKQDLHVNFFLVLNK